MDSVRTIHNKLGSPLSPQSGKPAAAVAAAAFPNQRTFFVVHVYIHYTDAGCFTDRMMQIKRKLTEEQFFPFPVTCTPVVATGVDSDQGIFDVYVIGGHRRYKLGIVAPEQRLPTIVEVVDTIGWAALRKLDSDQQVGWKESRRGSSMRHRSTGMDVFAAGHRFTGMRSYAAFGGVSTDVANV